MRARHPLNVSSFHPPFWLHSGHANTVWATVGKATPTIRYRRERFATSDGDFVDLDWMDGPHDAPILVALHGLEGSSESPYILRLMAMARSRGWRGVVLNARGCSGEENRRIESYHAGHTTDLAEVLTALNDERTPLLLVGYSLGGSQLANYLARHATKNVPATLRGAYLVSAPLLLEPGAEALKRVENQIYTWYFLWSLRRKLHRKRKVHPSAENRVRMALRARSIEAFDDCWTAPVHGYRDAADYYANAAAGPLLSAIRVPTRVLHAADDPFVPAASVPETLVASAPHVELDWHERGGHVGFVHGTDPYWLERRLLDWLAARAGSSVARNGHST